MKNSHRILRAEDLRLVVECLRRGACCSVVAPSDMGKSRFLKHLLADDMRRACAHNGHLPLMVFIDCREAGNSEQTFYELLLRRLVEELETTPTSPIFNRLKKLHTQILHSESELEARATFAGLTRELARDESLALVFILDKFDDLFRTFPAQPLRELCAMREQLGAQLTFVTATARRLDLIRADEATRDWRELFYTCTLILRPLSAEGIRYLIQEWLSEEGTKLTEDAITLAVELSGGHPGLATQVCRVFAAHVRMKNLDTARAVTLALQDDAVTQVCQRLWEELEEVDQQALRALVMSGQANVDAREIQTLHSKGLVTPTASTVIAFSPLLAKWIETVLAPTLPDAAQGVHCDAHTGHIWVDAREVTLTLSEPQRKLLKLLWQKKDQVVTYQEIVEQVWDTDEGVSPGAIYELVKRTRQKVEADWKHPKYIVTVAGEGYRLEE